MIDIEKTALRQLTEFVAPGPRFHGTKGIDVAADFLRSRLQDMGLPVQRTEVRTAGWTPGTATLTVASPFPRQLNAWPMLWSGSSAVDRIEATLLPSGEQGLWGDSQVWTKFNAVQDGRVVAYLHARNAGPAAPQPLPIGSDLDTPHVAIGHIDGLQISEWLADGFEVEVTLTATSATRQTDAVGENLTVHLPGRGDGGQVLVCGHYDTFWNTPGAYDNGSGTIALLLLAEQWLQQPPGPDVMIIFFTAEEWHLAGSRTQVAQTSPELLAALDYVLNLDGLGPGDLLESSTGPETFDDAVTKQIRAYGERTRNQLRVVPRFPPTCGTDHIAYYAAGVPSAHLTFNDPHRLHQPNDTPNPAIAANIAWTVGLVQHLVETLERPARTDMSRLLAMPF